MVEEDKTIPDERSFPPKKRNPVPGEKTTILHTRKNPSPDTNRIVVPPEVRVARANPDLHLNQYILIKKVGSGGMGTVWKAWDTKLARWVAIKFLDNANEVAIRRFEREAQLVAQLHHQNITGIHEINKKDATHYLVMDFIDGAPIGTEEIPLPSMLAAYIKVCRAVQFAHDHSIIHRDLKPENILLRKDGEPYVTDFGLGKALKTQSSLSITGSVIGTPVFMSPEQAAGDHDSIDTVSDVYALGATLYALVTGKAPFDSKNPSTILLEVATEEPLPPRKVEPGIPPEVEAIVLKAMEKKKGNRYPSADQMADDLQRFLDEKSVIAKAPGTLRRASRLISRNPWPFASLFLFVVVGGLAGYFILSSQGITNGQKDPGTDAQQIQAQKEAWKKSFKEIRPRLTYYGFQEASAELVRESRTLLKTMPASLSEETTAWFQKQLSLPPETLWPRNVWLDKKAESKRIEVWCLLILEILKERGKAFEQTRITAQEMASRFAPVGLYQGKISLKILIRPYAKLEALKVGEEWVIEKGKKTSTQIEVSEEDLFTPLVLHSLTIEPYFLIMTHPSLGKWEVTLPSENLENGGTYIYSGSFQNEESSRFRRLP